MAHDYEPQGHLARDSSELRGVDAPTTGHEPSGELSVLSLLAFFIGLVIALIIIYFLLSGVMNWFSAEEKVAMSIKPPRYANTSGMYPGDLRLQKTPEKDLEDLRKAEEVKLEAKAGWVDSKAKIAHIPIQDAMKLIAEKGLPARAPTKAKDKP